MTFLRPATWEACWEARVWMVRARLWTSWRSCWAGTSGCASRAASTERGDNGVASEMEAPAGEEGSEADGGEAGDSVDRLMEQADIAAWIEAFSQSGAW